MLREIREICGPFNHHGHVVSDIEKAMDDYLAMGVGPWLFFTKNRKDRWDAQERAGGGRKGKLRATQLHYGEPTAYRALVAFGFNAGVGIELVQPYNDEPSCHNDWLKSRGNGLQHINFTVPRDRYAELINACLDAGWTPSLQLLEGDGKEDCEEGQDVRTCFADFVDDDLELRSALLAAVLDVAKAQRSESPQPEATREALVAALRSSRSDGATSVDVHLGSLQAAVASEAG